MPGPAFCLPVRGDQACRALLGIWGRPLGPAVLSSDIPPAPDPCRRRVRLGIASGQAPVVSTALCRLAFFETGPERFPACKRFRKKRQAGASGPDPMLRLAVFCGSAYRPGTFPALFRKRQDGRVPWKQPAPARMLSPAAPGAGRDPGQAECPMTKPPGQAAAPIFPAKPGKPDLPVPADKKRGPARMGPAFP